VAHIAPFAVFVGIMGLEHGFSIPLVIGYPLRVAATLIVLLLFSRRYIPLRPSRPVAAVAMGLAVFAIWIGPDLLFGPGYRHFWLFENPVTGTIGVAAPPPASYWFLILRAAGSTLLVPPVEELFWRSWLMRWLINRDFLSVPLGKYAPSAFWITAILFASEHGSYWEVGLAAGVLYNLLLPRANGNTGCKPPTATHRDAQTSHLPLRKLLKAMARGGSNS
jgi:CAAX prenyl protease-like protein